MKKHSRNELSLPILIIIGCGAMIVGVLITTFIFAVISSITKNPTALTGILSLVSLLVAGAVTSFILAKVIRDGGTLIAIVSSVAVSLIMSVIGLIAKGGMISISVFLNYLAFIGTSSLFAFLAGKTGERKRRYR